ncbi:MAG: relaxase [Alphaproteobacteria bacterium]|nr:relaxase [Alphaproteobacteria bacterium]NKC02289.1 relaxase [Pseudomonadales bacterium]
MIPFASQRGSGQDLATHLLNEHDNEYMELADLRGAIADDLHGAFAEWEAEASAMTKCVNYLYSLSVNPDPAQGPISRDLYDDYISRVERALGLEAQPRAVVFHIKEDQQGVGREHCHVVWSRIDVREMKAIHMSFDHDKLMTVTRQFARDHDIELAPGYYSLEERKRQTHRQLSLYDKVQMESTGLSREDRRAVVTELWRGRDTPGSFVKALEYHGYVLATGRRPYLLVDIYGHTNSLPKLIDDKAANTNAIRAFLGEEYATDSMPSVEDAKEFAAEHRHSLKAFKQSQKRADRIDELKEVQAKRRKKIEREVTAFLDRQKQERQALKGRHRIECDTHRTVYLHRLREIKRERSENQPRGLAEFLSKVTGMDQVRHKLHRYRDKKRHDAFLDEKHETRKRQDAERLEHQRGQEMRALDMERKHRALDQTEQRELQSLEMSFKKQQAIRHRAGYEHMPSLRLELRPPGRKAVPHKAKNRFTSAKGRELHPVRTMRTRALEARENTVHKQFVQAAKGDRIRESVSSRTIAFKIKSNLSSQDESPPQPPKEPALNPKAKGNVRESHIEQAIREFDRNSEEPAPPKPTPPQAPQIENPARELRVERQTESPMLEPTPRPEALQREFHAAALGQSGHENVARGTSGQSSLEPRQSEEPIREFELKPTNNEPDRER